MMVSSSTEMNSDRQSTARITQRLSWTGLGVRTSVGTVYVSAIGAELRVARAVLMIFLSRAVVVTVGGSRSKVAPRDDEPLTTRLRRSSVDRRRAPSR